MTEKKGDWKYGSEFSSSALDMPLSSLLLPKPKKRRLKKKEKEKLLRPTPIPNDDELIELRQFPLDRFLGNEYRTPSTSEKTIHIYDQLVSMRQQLAELTDLMKKHISNPHGQWE